MTNLLEAVAVIRALRRSPASVPELSAATGIPARTVYRLLEALREAGAPLRESEGAFERKGRGGSAPTRFHLTATELSNWLGGGKRSR